MPRGPKLEPRLIAVAVPRRARGVVIVLHGGAARREAMMVSPAQLSVLRMIPLARAIARASGGQLAVFRLLNSRRGWDTTHTPVVDARWAIGQANARLERKLPICLVGHSLGGRAALLAAGEPQVVSAVALAPWVLSSDQPRDLDGKRILIVHGSLDRIASPVRSRALAQRISDRADVTYVVVDGARHAMLRHRRRFSRLACDFANESLLKAPDLQRVAG